MGVLTTNGGHPVTLSIENHGPAAGGTYVQADDQVTVASTVHKSQGTVLTTVHVRC
jgi:hypothetical protein